MPSASEMKTLEPQSTSKPSMRLVLSLCVFVVVFALGWYAWQGNRAGWSVDPASRAKNAANHEIGEAQILAMVARLEERLKAEPKDVEGWSMLGRSYSVLGRPQDALVAYRKVVELAPKEAQAYADLADATALANGRNLEGEPAKMIAKALALDSGNVKALALAGTMAYNRSQFDKAAMLWERALQNIDPSSSMKEQMQLALEDARSRITTPSNASASPTSSKTTSSQTASANAATTGGSVQGRVSLSVAVKSQANPEDTVFIFARNLQSGRAPLAILRTQVKNLPLEFTLDDSMAMNPAMRLSSVKEVVIGARVSKSGTATAQPGDLQGFSGSVAVGARGVQLEISETVR